MHKRMKLLLPLILLPVILLNLNCGTTPPDKDVDKIKIAPEFMLNDIEGKKVRLSHFRNKKNVLLTFGATWCPYCIDEIPELKEIYEKYNNKDVKLLYIDVQESKTKVNSFIQKHSIPYTVLLDVTGSVAGEYGVRGIPHIVLIDKKGEIFYEGSSPPNGLMSLIVKLTEGQN